MFLNMLDFQPFCGECAPIYFRRSPRAYWLRQYDLDAVMSNAGTIVDEAAIDIETLLTEVDILRLENQSGSEDGDEIDLFSPPDSVPSNVLDSIPRNDPTYRHISTTLCTHARIKGMRLLEFRTFSGAMAYQPCCKNIDLIGVFDILDSKDASGDEVFKIARSWSCIIQAKEFLPKDVRWILATIYNFAVEMLRPEIDETLLWKMRPWLMY